MKRTRFIALALVVALMMMGAGYAYWTEDLTISNTVDTGELDVVFVSPEWATEDTYMSQEPNGSYCELTNDTHALSIFLQDVYPGAQSTVKFTVENSGTLGAFVDDFTFMNIADDGTRTARNANAQENLILCTSLKVDNDTVILTGTTLEDALKDLNKDKGIFLEDEGTDDYNKEITMVLKIDTDADETSLPENSDFSFKIGANVYQYNDTRN